VGKLWLFTDGVQKFPKKNLGVRCGTWSKFHTQDTKNSRRQITKI